MFFDIEPSQCLPKRAINGLGGSLPARLLLGLTSQDGSVERKGLIGWCRMQVFSEAAHQMPPEVRQPMGLFDLGHHQVQLLEKLRLTHDDRSRTRNARRLKIGTPRQPGRQLIEFGTGEFVVVLFTIPQFRARATGFGQSSFQSQNSFRGILGLGFAIPQKPQLSGDVLTVLLPLLRKTLGQIVVPVGKTQPSLHQVQGVHRAVLGVGLNAHSKTSANPPKVPVRQKGHRRLGILNGLQSLPFGVQGCKPQSLDAIRLHGRGIKVTHLPERRTRWSIGVSGGRNENATDQPPIPLLKLIETGPTRFVGGHRVVLAPGAGGILIEIGLRIDRAVHIAHRKPRNRRRVLGRRCQAVQEQQTQINPQPSEEDAA